MLLVVRGPPQPDMASPACTISSRSNRATVSLRVRIAGGFDDRTGCGDSENGFILAGCGGSKRSGPVVGALPEKVAVGDRALSRNRVLTAGAEIGGIAGGD